MEGPFLPLEKKEKLIIEFTKLASEITGIPTDVFCSFYQRKLV